MSKKIYLILLVFIAVFGVCCLTSAQETISPTEVIAEVAAEELDIKEPGRFYWLKKIAWDAQAFFTADPIKKSEIKMKKAGSELLRARKLVKENPNDSSLQEKLDKINQGYKKAISYVNAKIENFKTKNPNELRVKNFINKYSSQQIKHQEILGNLEEKVPENVMQHLRVNRQEHLDRFGKVMNKLQTKDEFKHNLENIFGNTKEKVERKARKMNIIEELGQKVPEIRQRIEEFKIEKPEVVEKLKVKWRELDKKRKAVKQKLEQSTKQ